MTYVTLPVSSRWHHGRAGNLLKSPWETVRKLTRLKPRETSLLQRYDGHIGRPSPLPVTAVVADDRSRRATRDRAAAYRRPVLSVASTKLHHGTATQHTPISRHSPVDWTSRHIGMVRHAQIGRLVRAKRPTDYAYVTCQSLRIVQNPVQNNVASVLVIRCDRMHGRYFYKTSSGRYRVVVKAVTWWERDGEIPESVRDSESVVSAQWFSW